MTSFGNVVETGYVVGVGDVEGEEGGASDDGHVGGLVGHTGLV